MTVSSFQFFPLLQNCANQTQVEYGAFQNLVLISLACSALNLSILNFLKLYQHCSCGTDYVILAFIGFSIALNASLGIGLINQLDQILTTYIQNETGSFCKSLTKIY